MNTRHIDIIVLALLVLFLSTGCGKNDAFIAKTVDNSKQQHAEIENRITPFSVVNIAGTTAVAVVSLPGEAKYMACSACHGTNGEGGMGPALAGQTIEYIVGRLNQYKNGEKVGGQSNLMWGQAAGLSDQDIQDLAEYTATL